MSDNRKKNQTNMDTKDNTQIARTNTEKITNFEYLEQTIAMENRNRYGVLKRVKCRKQYFCQEQQNLSRLTPPYESKKKRL